MGTFLSWFLLLFFFLHPEITFSKHHNNETDQAALLTFKSHIHDPSGLLDSSWLPNTSFCTWLGVSCSTRRQRVVGLLIRSFSLEGIISSALGNLSFLTHLDLGNNSLGGTIPDSLGHLPRLAYFIINYNQLSGNIPSSIFNMSLLTHFSVTLNNLTGPLGMTNTSIFLPRLQFFSVEDNNLNGVLPNGFGRCLGLQGISFSTNEFRGSVPLDLINLPNLKILFLDTNNLRGSIPSSLGNLKGLLQLDLSKNNLNGHIPQELGNLLSLQFLNLANNLFTGNIPPTLSNATSLVAVDFSINQLTGTVPAIFGKNLRALNYLSFSWNQLTGGLDFINSLSSCNQLQNLYFLVNQLEGSIPESVGNLSQALLKLNADTNQLSGLIPSGFCNLSNIIMLRLQGNQFMGNIPPCIAELENLQFLALGENKLNGPIPNEFGRLQKLNQLSMENNMLTGAIPDSFGNLSSLQSIWLGSNNLSSSIPKDVWGLSNILNMYLSNNNFEGSIPSDIGNMINLDVLDLSANNFFGSIPDSFSQLQMLEVLDLSGNSFNGAIPVSFSKLLNIKYMNLSNNNFSGSIPQILVNLRYLVKLNLSFNDLEGEVPNGGIFVNITIQSLMGNKGLCGAPKLKLKPCPSNNTISNSKKNTHKLKIILPVVACAFFVSCFAFVLIYRWHRNTTTRSTPGNTETPNLENFNLISYYELSRATKSFSDSNIIGKGSSSSVYKGELDNGMIVAIKVLNIETEGSLRSFDSECHALGVIRHRNLVKVISACSNLDFKAIIIQFMPNGSLEKCLHSEKQLVLNKLQLLNIALDVAVALEYLHHRHHQVVLHCDVKPSNVLLDEDMNACLSDFGLSKLLDRDSRYMASATAGGTIGYMAPEYGSTGRASRKGDVYSYGVLVLQMFTGKKPTDRMFEGGLGLRQWVLDAYPSQLAQVLNNNLRLEDGGPADGCLSFVIELALECSEFSPKNRASMDDVVPRLQKIKTRYLEEFLET